MSSCRITTNLTSGSGVQKPTDPEKAKEMNDKLAAMMALREKQDKDAIAEPLTEKEYEAKYGKQPGSTDAKKPQ